MGRPKVPKGDTKIIRCVNCGSESLSGYKVDLTICEAEVTPDWFVAYDSHINDYNAFFCSKDCIVKYIQEELK